MCPPQLYHSISPKRLGVWSSCLVNFLSMYIPFRKVQFHQSALKYVDMATMQIFGLFLKTRILIVFQGFPPEKNFLWDNFLCFGHKNSLISSIKANMRCHYGNIPENHFAQIWSSTLKQLISAMFHSL